MNMSRHAGHLLAAVSAAAGAAALRCLPTPRSCRPRRRLCRQPADAPAGHRHRPAPAAPAVHRQRLHHAGARQKQQAQAQYFPTLTPTYQFQNSSKCSLRRPRPDRSPSPTTTGPARERGRGPAQERGRGRERGRDAGRRQPARRPRGRPPPSPTRPTRSASCAAAACPSPSPRLSLTAASANWPTPQARRAVEAAGYNETNMRQDIILTVTQDYYNLLHAIDLVKVAQAQVARYQQTLDVTQAQVHGRHRGRQHRLPGPGRPGQRPGDAAARPEQRQHQLGGAEERPGRGDHDAVCSPPRWRRATSCRPCPPPARSRRWTRTSDRLRQPPRPAPAAGHRREQQRAVKAAQINAGLSVSTTYALTYQATNDVGYRGLDTQLLLNGSYPLFDAGRARGAVRVARAQRDAAQDQLAQIRQSIRQDVEQAYGTRAEALKPRRSPRPPCRPPRSTTMPPSPRSRRGWGRSWT